MAEEKEKKGFFARLKAGLAKTRDNIVESFTDVFGASHIDDDFYENLEETFIMADMGYETTVSSSGCLGSSGSASKPRNVYV